MDPIIARIFAFVLGMLALAGVAYGGYEGYQWYRSNTIVEGITMMQTNIAGLYAQSGAGYGSLTTANAPALINQNVFPPSWVRGGNTLIDPWGNAVALASGGNATQGVITIGGGGSQNVETCSRVVMGLSNYVSLAVGNQTFTKNAAPDPVAAGAACDGQPTISVTFQ
uniref:type 4 pilus major pilin n=1 Tax=Burkholderia arboris TaxID=488730 RepID=UPI003BEF2926